MERSKEDAILLAHLSDKVEQCIDRYHTVSTYFLDSRQRSLAESRYQNNAELSRNGVRLAMYGGFADAERCTALFLPDYILLEKGVNWEEIDGYYQEHPEENPLALLRVKKSGEVALTHRDYLGALTGLGIRREIIGDILVRNDGADIIIIKDMGSFLLSAFEKAGRANLNCELLPLRELTVPKESKEEFSETVASLRLDNLTAAAFSSSRSDATEAILRGIVFVNGVACQKPDAAVREGDKLVLRGKGKVVLKKVGKVTKKGRIFITLERYL